MSREPDTAEVAAALRTSIGLLLRRLRQRKGEGELALRETAALSLIDRGGPATPGALAKLEGISPQSMGATLASLEARGLVKRGLDPSDGRRIVISLTRAGGHAIRDRRSARTEQLARALASNFTAAELKKLMAAAPLLERLAESI